MAFTRFYWYTRAIFLISDFKISKCFRKNVRDLKTVDEPLHNSSFGKCISNHLIIQAVVKYLVAGNFNELTKFWLQTKVHFYVHKTQSLRLWLLVYRIVMMLATVQFDIFMGFTTLWNYICINVNISWFSVTTHINFEELHQNQLFN